MLLIGVWLNWLLQYVRNSSDLAPNDISVVAVVASAIWDNNRLVILLTCAESVAAE